MRITVHGATGAQGGPVAAALQAAGHEVVGLSRAAGGGNVAADINDQASLEAAYEGSDAVFVHLPIPADPAAPAVWVPAILGAITNSGIKRVVVSTSGASLEAAGPHPMLQGRFRGATAFYGGLQAAADSVVALTPRLFLENLLLPFVSGPAVSDGVLSYPLPADKPISWISHLDVADAAVVAFDESTEAGAYDLGISPITGPQLAAEIGNGLGLELRYEAITPGQFTERATPLLGPEIAAGVGGLYEAFATDHTLAIPDNSRRLGRREPRTVARWAAVAFPYDAVG